MLQHVKPGQEFEPKAQDWNSFVDAARWVKDRQTGFGVDSKTATGIIRVRNDDASDAPRGALLWVRDMTVAGSVAVEQPDYPAVSMLLVADAPIVSGEFGTGLVAGLVKVLCDDYADLAPGDRVGAQGGSWYAHYFALGPLLVQGQVQAEDQPASLPEGVGLVWALFSPPGRRM